MQIGKISLRRPAQAAEKTPANHSSVSQKLSSNPFGVSFKGNVIQADVFQSGAKKAASGLMSGKGKVFASAVVSGINNFNEAFKSRLNAIGAFAKKVTSNVFDSIEKFGNTEIKFDMESVKNKLFPNREYGIKKLAEQPVDKLRTMWTGLIPKTA